MNVIDRFHRAFDSTLGILFIGLVLVLVLLGIAYWVMMWRQRRRDVLAYLHQGFYRKAESLATSFHFIGIHKADFFGRQSPVLFTDRAYGLCTIPSPDVVDEDVCDRFRDFSRTLATQRSLVFAPYRWQYDEEMLVVVQGNLLQNDGCPLSPLQRYLLDKRLGKAYTEEILLEVARGMAALHRLKTERGEPLYHGFLLPRSLFIDFDVNRSISEIVIGDAGMAYALGPEKVYQRISLLRAGKLPIEKFTGYELLEQIGMLAPEQKDSNRLQEVSQQSDFYAFGALAVVMFAREGFRDYRSIDWSAVPVKWRSFLQGCLEDDISCRPKNFLELEDWLTDPDLALTLRFRDNNCEDDSDDDDFPEVSLDSLVGVLQRVQQGKGLSLRNSAGKDKFGQCLEAGLKALKMSRWSSARKYLTKAIDIRPDDADAHVSLAIACYELGDLGSAELHYEKARKTDPNVAKCFREHIAFRV